MQKVEKQQEAMLPFLLTLYWELIWITLIPSKGSNPNIFHYATPSHLFCASTED